MSWPVLETERLILREWRESDLDAWAQMEADPEVMRWIGRDRTPVDRTEAWRVMAMFVGHFHLRGYSHWAIEEKESGRFIGRAGPWMPEGWPELEVGWAIDSARWGLGYATEAARAAVGWVHRELGAHSVVHFIEEANMRSIRVAEKLGAKAETTFKLLGKIDTRVYRTSLPLGSGSASGG
jgi:RimJ/RimL family protein N-acetyltransferase